MPRQVIIEEKIRRTRTFSFTAYSYSFMAYQQPNGMADRTNIKSWIASNYHWLLIILIGASFAPGELYRHLISLLALIGLYRLIKQPKEMFRSAQIKALLLLFLCLWIPMLISLFDAAYPDQSIPPTARYLEYFLAGVAVVTFPYRADTTKLLIYGATVILLFWSLDGLVQLVFGKNLMGYPPYDQYRITGMFYPSPRLGFVLAVLSPLLFEGIRQLMAKWSWAWLLLVPMLAAILFGGSRTSWMLFVISGSGYLAHLYQIQQRIEWRKWLPRAALLFALVVVLMDQVGWLRERATAVTDVFSDDYAAANAATSLRLPLWKTALTITSRHWVNGIGPRAYSLAYDEYAEEGDFWIGKNTGHPHLFLLEISSETGLVGLIGYGFFLVLLLRRTWRCRHHTRGAAPWGLAAFIAAFPLSSTVPFYAHFSSALIWYLTIVFLHLSHRPALASASKI